MKASDLATVPLPPPTYGLWAELKRSSRYYAQGLDEARKPVRYPVRLDPSGGEYCVRFNNNCYRLADVTLFARVEDTQFFRIKP